MQKLVVTEIKRAKTKAKMTKKKSKSKNAVDDIVDADANDVEGNSEEDSDDNEPESDEEQNKLDYIDLVKKSLYNTKSILENINEHGELFTQLRAVFDMFSGAIKVEVDENQVKQDLEVETVKSGKTSYDSMQDKIEVLNIP